MGPVIDCAAYEQGRRVATLEIDRIGETCGSKDRFIWIGLYEPTEELLRKLQAQFRLHDLAIEDALQAHQRSKLEVYDESLFLVMHTAQIVGDKILTGETHVFIGRGYVVTIRHGPSVSYSDVRSRCESSPRRLRKGEDFVLYSLMDFVVDNYFPVVDAIEKEVDEIEDNVFKASFERKDIERIHELRRQLLRFRRAVSPLLDICSRLSRLDLPFIDKEMQPYFRDVHDHVIRVNESIDALRDLLTAALESNLQLAALHQNEVTKRLAGWAAILAVPTAVAGIYGMNFRHMPELDWPYGYPLVMALIGAVCAYLFYRFRKAGWL